MYLSFLYKPSVSYMNIIEQLVGNGAGCWCCMWSGFCPNWPIRFERAFVDKTQKRVSRIAWNVIKELAMLIINSLIDSKIYTWFPQMENAMQETTERFIFSLCYQHVYWNIRRGWRNCSLQHDNNDINSLRISWTRTLYFMTVTLILMCQTWHVLGDFWWIYKSYISYHPTEANELIPYKVSTRWRRPRLRPVAVVEWFYCSKLVIHIASKNPMSFYFLLPVPHTGWADVLTAGRIRWLIERGWSLGLE